METKESPGKSHEEYMSEATRNIVDGFSRQEKEHPSAAKEMASLSPDFHVLIVDDSRVIGLMTKRHLQEFGREKVYKAVNGDDALEAMQQDKELQQVPILMVTLHNSRDNVMAAMKAGFFSYIVKPLNPQVLEKKLR